jgi:hypothetical protein
MLDRFFSLSSYIADTTPYCMVDAHLNIFYEYITRMVLKYFFCLSVHLTEKYPVTMAIILRVPTFLEI